MASTPQYAATPRASSVAINTANTALDGTGTLGTLITAGSNGTRVDTIIVKGGGSTSIGLFNLFLYNGSTSFLIHQESIAAVTVSSSQTSLEIVIDMTGGMVIPAGSSLKVGTSVANLLYVTAVGGDF